MLDQAIDALGVGAKDLQEFEMEDTFNCHLLRGYLCRRPDHRYGALYLTHVNGEEEAQLIFATPKLHYPFDRAGTYCFPPAREVLVFEKLDGTNILGFRYHWRGQSFLTYKLRLSPIVRNSPHGPFLDLWREILQQHPEIPSLPPTPQWLCHQFRALWGSQQTPGILRRTFGRGRAFWRGKGRRDPPTHGFAAS